jgi:Mn2+/Fe2+ NRAMP family transporter
MSESGTRPTGDDPSGRVDADPGPTPPTGTKARLKQVGPGLLAAATGVGAGDLVATMIAGSQYGYVLLWAALLGTVLKLGLAEGVGRWHLASGSTLLDGWRRLGRWATVFFGIYIVVWGLVYGATAMSAVGLPLNALFPVLDVRYWAMIAGVAGLALVWAQRYNGFEKVMVALTGVMFVSVIVTAVLVRPDPVQIVEGLLPRLPQGSVVYVLGLVGGVGGTITLGAYGYWMLGKGWRGTGWLSMMRLDNAIGYVLTGVFVVAMLLVGAEVLLGQELTSGDSGLLVLGDELAARYGEWSRIVFLVGFFAVSATSLLGVWNGVSLLFADWTRIIRLPHGSRAAAEVGSRATTDGGGTDEGDADGRRAAEEAADRHAYHARAAERSPAFRLYLVWLTVPPMALLFLDRPFAVTLVYGVLGAAFMPFLGGTLLVLLNSRHTPAASRSGWLSNLVVGIAAVLFVVLLVTDLIDRFG